MEVLQPTFGLFFWSLLIFLVFFFLLKKFAWGPILKALKTREDEIENSLMEAQKARDEMQHLHAENEKILKEARFERENILKEARELKDKIVSEAREQATVEAQRVSDLAREDIRAEKMAAITEIKNQVGKLSIEIAEKILRKELSNKVEQQEIVDRLIAEDFKLN